MGRSAPVFKKQILLCHFKSSTPSKIMKDFFITFVLWALSLITTDRINLRNRHSLFCFALFFFFHSFFSGPIAFTMLCCTSAKWATPVCSISLRNHSDRGKDEIEIVLFLNADATSLRLNIVCDSYVTSLP